MKYCPEKSIIFAPCYEEIVVKTRFFSIGKTTNLEKIKLWIQNRFTPLKIDFVSHPASGKRAV